MSTNKGLKRTGKLSLWMCPLYGDGQGRITCLGRLDYWHKNGCLWTKARGTRNILVDGELRWPPIGFA